MTSLCLKTVRISTAALGPVNPLPPLHPPRYIADVVQVDESVPSSARRYLGYGCDTGCLPYSQQDGYTRQRQPRDIRVAVLENEILRATFLLPLGGRLWSLVHKPTGRELLYVNQMIQPTNQAVRGAWFSGGVEWNMSVRGHSPLTCSPLFAKKVTDENGSEMLRMYEWDRIRRVPFVIDCSLPTQSSFLVVHVHLANPHDETIPMYWWSNIAVPEAPDVRVLVPTDHAYRYGYQDRLKRIRIPASDAASDADPDATYPTNHCDPADYFFDIPQSPRPWITALDRSGCGLIQTSTARLRGRKMFVWGMGPGGRRWQRFLNEHGKTYLEIQAGLAQTQYECLPMPPRSQWSWIEAYGLMQADPTKVHGEDWGAARDHVAAVLQDMLPAEALEKQCDRDDGKWPDLSAGEMLQSGSPWAALEKERINVAGKRTLSGPIANFPEASPGEEQQPWLQLLTDGTFPYRQVCHSPGAWIVGEPWRDLLLKAAGNERSNHWFSWLHLGVMAYSASDTEAASEAWRRSIDLEPSAWAYHHLALLAIDEGDREKAVAHFRQSHQLLPDQLQIAIEFGQVLLDSGDYKGALTLNDEVIDDVRDHPRFQLLAAEARFHLGDAAAIESLFGAMVEGSFELPDLREGESLLTDLWSLVQAHRLAGNLQQPVSAAIRAKAAQQFPPPAEIDFRMGRSETH